MYKTKNISKWIGYSFEPIENKTDKDFAAFARNIKSEINAQIKNSGYEIAAYTKGYFYISGFIRDIETNTFMYFNIGDVRYDARWHENILVRTAKDTHDFTGGTNRKTSLAEFGNTAKRILKYAGNRRAA